MFNKKGDNLTKDRYIGVRTTDELVRLSTEVTGKDISKTIIQALEELVMNHRTELEKLEDEEKQLTERLKEVKILISKEKQRIREDVYHKKAIAEQNSKKTPLETVKENIRKNLDSVDISSLLNSIYFKAYQKQLDYTPEQVRDLIMSVATDEEKEKLLNRC